MLNSSNDSIVKFKSAKNVTLFNMDILFAKFLPSPHSPVFFCQGGLMDFVYLNLTFNEENTSCDHV
jgi:hypothetical protein